MGGDARQLRHHPPVSYRDEREALRRQVKALEQELAERDAELDALRGPSRAAPGANARLSIRTDNPQHRTVGYVWLGMVGTATAVAMLRVSWRALWLPAVVVAVAGAAPLFTSRTIVVDRSTRSIQIVRQLILRWRRTLSLEDRPLVLVRIGDDAARLLLGETCITSGTLDDVGFIAMRIAEFAEVPLIERGETAEELRRHASPIAILSMAMVLVFLVALVTRLLGYW